MTSVVSHVFYKLNWNAFNPAMNCLRWSSLHGPLTLRSTARQQCALNLVRRWITTPASTSNTRQWSTPLAKQLAEAITTTGPISVAAYMRQCLTNPESGYYTSRTTDSDQFGKRGDFITSPEISQVFGELLGIWVVAEWSSQGIRDRKISLLEIGPGRGTLMDDMLRTLQLFKPVMANMGTVYLVEASKPLREAQHRLLCGDHPLETIDIGHRSRSKHAQGLDIIWCEDLKFVPHDSTTVPYIVAHEFFDALPIHVFQSVEKGTPATITTSTSSSPDARVKKMHEWREMLVTPVSPFETSRTAKSAGNATPDFELSVSQAPTPHSQLLPRTSARYNTLLSTEGSVIEISPESLGTVADFARRIGGNSPSSPGTQQTPLSPAGAALIIDYGPTSTIPTNSLRGIRSHKQVSPFTLAGQADLSADVDFLGLAHAALDASPGVEVHGPADQALFLSRMGIKQRADALIDKAGNNEETRARIEKSWRRLVDRGPDGMGKTYKVMAILPFRPEKEMRRPVGFGGELQSCDEMRSTPSPGAR